MSGTIFTYDRLRVFPFRKLQGCSKDRISKMFEDLENNDTTKSSILTRPSQDTSTINQMDATIKKISALYFMSLPEYKENKNEQKRTTILETTLTESTQSCTVSVNIQRMPSSKTLKQRGKDLDTEVESKDEINVEDIDKLIYHDQSSSMSHHQDEIEQLWKFARRCNDLSLGAKESFACCERIKIEVHRSCRKIVVNCDVKVLKVLCSSFKIKFSLSKEKKELYFELESGQLFKPEEGLEIIIVFEGEFQHNMRGIYLDNYANIVTQHEPSACQTIICNDEPGFRSTIEASFIVKVPRSRYDETFVMLSNQELSEKIRILDDKNQDYVMALATFDPLETAMYRWGITIGNFETIECDYPGFEKFIDKGVVGYYPAKMIEDKARTSLFSDLSFLVESSYKALEYMHMIKLIDKYRTPTLKIIVIINFEAGAMENEGMTTINPDSTQLLTMFHELGHLFFGLFFVEMIYAYLFIAETHTALIEMTLLVGAINQGLLDDIYMNMVHEDYLQKVFSVFTANDSEDEPIISLHELSYIERQIRFDIKIYYLAVAFVVYFLKFKSKDTSFKANSLLFNEIAAQMRSDSDSRDQRTVSPELFYEKMENAAKKVIKGVEWDDKRTFGSVLLKLFAIPNHPLLIFAVDEEMRIRSIRKRIFTFKDEKIEQRKERNFEMPLVFHDSAGKGRCQTLFLVDDQTDISEKDGIFYLSDLDTTGGFTFFIHRYDCKKEEREMIHIDLFQKLIDIKSEMMLNTPDREQMQSYSKDLNIITECPQFLLKSGYVVHKYAPGGLWTNISEWSMFRQQMSTENKLKIIRLESQNKNTELQKSLMNHQNTGCLSYNVEKFDYKYFSPYDVEMIDYAIQIFSTDHLPIELSKILNGNPRNWRSFDKYCENETNIRGLCAKMSHSSTSQVFEFCELIGMLPISDKIIDKLEIEMKRISDTVKKGQQEKFMELASRKLKFSRKCKKNFDRGQQMCLKMEGKSQSEFTEETFFYF